MKKWVKITLWIVPFGLIALFLWAAYDAVKKISFDYDSNAIKLIDLAASLLLLPYGETKTTSVTLMIKNENPIDISFSDLYIEVSKNDVLLAKSSDIASNSAKQTLSANTTQNFNYYIDIIKSDELLSLLSALKIFGAQEQNLKYYISGKIYGWIPFWYHGTFTFP